MASKVWPTADPVPESECVELGYVNGIFGVRGEVRLFLHNRDADWLGTTRAVRLRSPDNDWYRVSLATRRGAGKRILGRIDGVNSREEAAAISGWRIVIREAELPAPDSGEFYVRDIVGLPVFVADERAGQVRDLHPSGPFDVIEVEHQDGGVSFIPALSEYVVAIDLDGGRVELAPGVLGDDD